MLRKRKLSRDHHRFTISRNKNDNQIHKSIRDDAKHQSISMIPSSWFFAMTIFLTCFGGSEWLIVRQFSPEKLVKTKPFLVTDTRSVSEAEFIPSQNPPTLNQSLISQVVCQATQLMRGLTATCTYYTTTKSAWLTRWLVWWENKYTTNQPYNLSDERQLSEILRIFWQLHLLTSYTQ